MCIRDRCPICHAPAEKFVKQEGEMTWASEHVVGVAKGVSEDILADLRANFEGECSEVGMYLACLLYTSDSPSRCGTWESVSS